MPELATWLETRDEVATYVVATDDPVYQDHLPHFGYAPAGSKRFERSFRASPSAPRIHANFECHLVQILRQAAGLDPVPWEEALETFLRRVEGAGLTWFLGGSGALAVRGIPVAPGDLDFNVSDPHAMGRLLDDALVEPVCAMTGWAARWFGRAFHAAIIEWIADPEPRLDVPEPHEHGLHASRRLETIDWRGHQILVPPLALQLRTAERRGLDDRAAMIRAAID
jgi:hypothetical protein